MVGPQLVRRRVTPPPPPAEGQNEQWREAVAKGTQRNTEALCQRPPPPIFSNALPLAIVPALQKRLPPPEGWAPPGRQHADGSGTRGPSA